MSFQPILRICHFIKNIRRHTIIKSSAFYISAFIAGIFASGSLHAESNVVSNVAGDVIIIYGDDGFKPAMRDLSNTGSETQADSGTKKNPVLVTRDNATPVFYSGASPDYSIAVTPSDTASDGSLNGNDKNIAPQYARGGRLGNALDINLSEPEALAPDDAADVAEVERDDLWQRIKNGYAMPESKSSLTAHHEAWYSSRPDYVKRMVERSQRYLFHIVEEVEKRGMPTEIALLPMVESAYNPKAISTSRAAGIWQFIPSTGKHFGLKQDWWVDNRRNIIVATDAALTYLQKLHAMFGAWDLALAAYNAGEGTVGRAIERNRKRGLPTDYDSLDLPAETRNYVPKLQAVKNLMTNPGNYGLNIQTIANTPYFAKVTAPAKMDAHLAARLAEISDEEFLALNPSYNRPVITTSNKNLELLLPILSAQTFRTNLASYDKPLVSWKTYFAKRGERLDKIARKFGIQVSKLRDVNNLSSHSKIRKTAPILVPNGNKVDFNADKARQALADGSQPPAETSNTTQTEKTLPATDLTESQTDLADNSQNSDEAEPIILANVTHKVRKGETMQAIAKRYGVSVKQIITANSLKTTRLKVGQLLTIDRKSVDLSGANHAEVNKNTGKKQTYVVKRGDTLHSIAQKFDVAVADLKRWNNMNSNNIKAGNVLTIIQSDEV